MKMTGNTILITGGGSGIGLGLAEAFLKLGNQVLVASRSKDKLANAAKKGLKTYTVDMTNAGSIKELANQTIKDYPNLNVVIHNAGIMQNELLLRGGSAKTEDETVMTNLLGPMRLTDALLPHFQKQKDAVIVTVTSGLGFVPFAMTPTYCATKAAIHSYTQSLRYQLKATPIEVIELIPPYVATELMGARQKQDPNAMPLNEFVTEVMKLPTQNPKIDEVAVQRVHAQRFAGFSPEPYAQFFNSMNERLVEARKAELT